MPNPLSINGFFSDLLGKVEILIVVYCTEIPFICHQDFQAVQEDTGGVEIGILKMWIVLDQTNKITFLNSQETGVFFFYGVRFFFFLHMSPLCIDIGLPESFERITLYACLGTWRGALFGFSYFVFLFSGSSPADS